MESNNQLQIRSEGESLYLRLSASCYEKEAVTAATYWYTNQFTVMLDNDSDGYITVALHRLDHAPIDEPEALASKLVNAILDYQLRLELDRQTGDLRHIVFEHAFSAPRGTYPQKKR